MEQITKDDLRQFGMQLLHDIEMLIDKKVQLQTDDRPKELLQEWIRSKSIRSIMNISPGTLQNIRITGKIRFRKIMGSYYYNRTDLLKLFGDGNQ
ncbi:helix-turn-helix domain-containing protein [Chryseobacterium paludis]|uniref:helix-turn-helix domain-containing protein n=1 Tax=Chryseobacterium paludis TaxID=2956784 RepID=UPI0021C0BB6C|nr:helix-turn-helix domain-containing protein [Chryseobacterium paludis]